MAWLGSANCPAAFVGLVLPLLVLYVDGVVVVFDDALNGLWCYALPTRDLEGPRLPEQDGWTRIPEPLDAHKVVLPILQRLLVGSLLVAR